ncbi:MAG TPA: rhomboid-like protein [Mycobacterium sp.]|nr:rhomboid-like protein [Mycobacterium sp.]
MAPFKIWLVAAWHFVRSAPLTYLWLTVLLITTVIQNIAGRRLHTLLVDQSTNLHHLATEPLEVLFASLLWIDGNYWTPYLVLFTLFLAPAERWLGHLRWLAIGLTAHVGATYLSEGALYLLINLQSEPERLVYARDIGVSYFLVGVMAVLTYHIHSPWRWVYLPLLVVIVTFPVVIRADFTAIGHVAAMLIGLACYPLTRWHPLAHEQQ